MSSALRTYFKQYCSVSVVAMGLLGLVSDSSAKPVAKTPSPIVITAKLSKAKARVGKPLPIQFKIKNQSTKSVTIVRALDGSDSGWRSPKISIEVRDASNKLVDIAQPGRCAMVNRLMAEDFIVLAPKKSHSLFDGKSFGHYVLRWVPSKVGTYTVKLRYDVSFSGKEKGQSSPALVETHKPLRGVYESNALRITVRK